jgi:selenocysteine-specific elongation factor
VSLYPLVLGTAGHIDHGKTSLVQALTGIDTDRLPVEKARGITTELGFAHLDLGGKRLAVVDVPGHERFVKSMAAGATGLDLVCMVIAADEGMMPQTREHLDICQLLGVRRGLVALTKRDLVDDEWLAMATEEVRAALAGSFLADAPIVAVSARSGAGLPELRAALGKAVADLPPRDRGGVFRLPVDRIFTIKGFGTVVTGTVIGGEVSVGAELVVLPHGLPARVRGIEVHGEAVQSARAGLRAALNLGGVAVDDLVRGDVLAHPGAVPTSHILDVRFRYLAAATEPLPRRSKALVHHGATQVLASLVLDGDGVAPGAEVTGQLRLDATTPLAALPGDRFIARGFAPLADHGSTIGGGEIVRVLAARARKAGDHAADVDRLAGARLTDRLAIELRAAGPAGRTAADLARRAGQPREAIAAALEPLVLGGEVLATGDPDAAVYLHGQIVAELEAAIVAPAGAEPVTREAVRAALSAGLPPRAFDAIVAGLVRRGAIVADGDAIRPAGGAALPRLGPLDEELVARFRAWKLEAPRPTEVAAAVGKPDAAVKSALDRLLAHKLLVKVKPDLYLDAGVVAELRARLVAHLDAHGEITPQQWKDVTGASRKYSIPLAEYFDAEKVTLRIGDVRKKRQK